jgi:hypothetical protein
VTPEAQTFEGTGGAAAGAARRRAGRVAARRVVAGLLLALVPACAGRGPSPETAGASDVAGVPEIRYHPAPELQRLMDPRPAGSGVSWLGGDGVTSVALDADRVLFLFGDTLLGSVEDRCPPPARYCDRKIDRDAGRGMIPNSVGMIVRGPDGTLSPLRTFWRTSAGAPAPIFASDRPEEILWPLAAVRVGGQLLVAASRHTRESGLHAVGSDLLRVDDVAAPPDGWTYELHPFPNMIDYTRDPVPLTWTTSLVRSGRFVYVFGERGVGFEGRTVVSRLDTAAVQRLTWQPAPEYLLDDPAGGMIWSPEFELARLHEVEGLPGTSEMTVGFDPVLGWYAFQIPPLGYEIRLYTATGLLGPWRDRGVVYAVPGPWSTRRSAGCPDGDVACGQPIFSAYAVKAHPALAALVGAPAPILSYNVNVADGRWRSAVAAAEEIDAFYVPRMLSPTVVARPVPAPDPEGLPARP